MSTEPLVLVDVYNLVYRSFFAFRELRYEGRHTGTYYGFLSAVLALRKQFGTRLLFCWDYGLPGCELKPNWRKAIFPAYKASRTHTDEGLVEMMQKLPELHRVLTALGWVSIGVPGLEADDVIGIVSRKDPALIFSTDRDLYQLLEGARVRIIIPKKRGSTDYQLLTQTEVEKSHGLRPLQWAKYLALGGDASDGIHVMAGVGPKTAIKMVHAGADPSKFWSDNPESFTGAFPKYREHWPNFMAAYAVANIPRFPHDPRIQKYVGVGSLAGSFQGYIRASVPGSLEALRGFCADNGLMVLMSQTREFL